MLKIIVRHLFGQGVISFINILVGIFFIRWLPIEEFAVYALVVIVQSVVAAFSDFGVAGGVNTLTSQLSKEIALPLLLCKKLIDCADNLFLLLYLLLLCSVGFYYPQSM